MRAMVLTEDRAYELQSRPAPRAFELLRAAETMKVLVAPNGVAAVR